MKLIDSDRTWYRYEGGKLNLFWGDLRFDSRLAEEEEGWFSNLWRSLGLNGEQIHHYSVVTTTGYLHLRRVIVASGLDWWEVVEEELT